MSGLPEDVEAARQRALVLTDDPEKAPFALAEMVVAIGPDRRRMEQYAYWMGGLAQAVLARDTHAIRHWLEVFGTAPGTHGHA